MSIKKKIIPNGLNLTSSKENSNNNSQDDYNPIHLPKITGGALNRKKEFQRWMRLNQPDFNEMEEHKDPT